MRTNIIPAVITITEIPRNVIVNGNFDTDTDWTKASGVTISGGKLIVPSGAPATVVTASVPPLIVGREYTITIDIESISGSLKVKLGTGLQNSISTTGVSTFVGTAVTNGDFGIYRVGFGHSFTINSVSAILT